MLEIKPKRASKKPIFISIASELPDVNKLSGKYDFHSLENNTAVFVRNGAKIEELDGRNPYYMVYNNVQQIWTLTDADYFEEIKAKGEGGGWLALHTKGFRLEFFTSSLKSRVKELVSC